MARPKTKTAVESQSAWKARNYDRVSFWIRKGDKEKLVKVAKEENVSVARLLVDSVNARYPDLLSPLIDESKKKKETASDPQNTDSPE